jgi:predicted metal-binding membrane protein
MTAARPDRVWLISLLIAGYLTVWMLFGVVAHVADLGIHQAVGRSATFERHAWVIGAGVLFIAGVYQFIPLKFHCLEQCRSPRAFIAGRWRGSNERRQSFQLGIQHGIFCVGCCWSLMLLMFLVGAGNLFWMLLLGAVMAIEKNMSWGRELSTPLGVSLVIAGCAIALLAIL